MTELSPAAQAVLDAYWKPSPLGREHWQIAAALRAAADYAHRSSYATQPSTDWGDGWGAGVRDVARGLLAIAAELEGQ